MQAVVDELAGPHATANVYLGPRNISLLDTRLANRGRRTERLYLVRFEGCAACQRLYPCGCAQAVRRTVEARIRNECLRPHRRLVVRSLASSAHTVQQRTVAPRQARRARGRLVHWSRRCR